MISWITGEVISLWQNNNKFFLLINCNGLGYEIQILENFFMQLKTNQHSRKNINLWLRHIKKEESDSLFGFVSKDQKDFFNEILSIKGVGSQIGMALLNKFSINEIINAINKKDKKLIASVQGIGQKMTDRIILELQSNLKTKSEKQEKIDSSNFISDNKELTSILNDIDITLQSLKYPRKEIKNIFPILINYVKNNKVSKKEKSNLSFEILLKEAMNVLDTKNSNLGQ